jgi:hypothetical protein
MVSAAHHLAQHVPLVDCLDSRVTAADDVRVVDRVLIIVDEQAIMTKLRSYNRPLGKDSPPCTKARSCKRCCSRKCTRVRRATRKNEPAIRAPTLIQWAMHPIRACLTRTTMTARSSVPCNGTSTSAAMRNRQEKEALTHRSKPSTSFPLVPARTLLSMQHTRFPPLHQGDHGPLHTSWCPGPNPCTCSRSSTVRTRRPSCLVKLQFITSESIGHAASFSDAFPYRKEGMNERVSCTFWARPVPFVCPRPLGCFL